MRGAAERSAGRLHRVAAAVVVIELVLIAGFGIWAARNEYYQYGDEMVHFSYTKYVADHHRLPQLGRAVVPQDVLALNRDLQGGVMDCNPSIPNRGLNLCGIYEAFQPPLYYVVTAPIYALGRAGSLGGSEYRAFTMMRLFGVVMLLVAAGLAILLVREVVGPTDMLPVSAFVLVVFLLPATVIRFVTLANAVLELPLALAFVILVWRAWTRDSVRALLGAAVVLGLCGLTKVTLLPLAVPLVVAAAVLVSRRHTARARAVGLAAAIVVVPLLLMAPWLLYNRATYGTWTADNLAKDIQRPVINPTNQVYGYGRIVDEATDELQRLAAPQEWMVAQDRGIDSELRWALALVLAGVPLLLALARGLGWRRPVPDDVGDPRALVILVLPLPLTVALLAYEMRTQRWDVMLGRYWLFAVPPLVVFGALQWRAALGLRRLVVLGAGSGAVAVVLWATLVPNLPAHA